MSIFVLVGMCAVCQDRGKENINSQTVGNPSNSFEAYYHNRGVNINYRYIEDRQIYAGKWDFDFNGEEIKQIHDYSGNWDFDGDGITDSVMFVGTGGAHTMFFLRIVLSLEKKEYDFEWLTLDYPYLEPIESLLKRDNDFSPKFVVHDFNEDGILDIYLNTDPYGYIQEEFQAFGLTSNQVIAYYDIGDTKIVIKNW